MKKITGFILGACIVFSSVSAYAAEPLNLYYDNQWHIYNSEPVRIKVNGEEVQGDMPPVLLNDSTLVPARLVFEKMGAAVTWDETKSQVGVALDSINLVLSVNSNKATVNGTEHEMKIPAKIINSRTMIPVRFVSETLGLNVNWDDVNRIVSIDRKGAFINGIQKFQEGNFLRITVFSDKPINDYSAFTIKDNPRIVVDIKDAILTYNGGDINISNDYISKVRIAQTSKSPDVTRIVADVKNWAGYKVTLSADKKRLFIDFDLSPAEVSKIGFTKQQDSESVDISMNYDRNISLYSIGDGKRVYVNIPLAKLTEIQGIINASGNIVKTIETKQTDNSVSMTMETKMPCVTELVKGDTGLKLVFSPISSRRLEYSFDGKPVITLNSEYSGINYYNYSTKYENGNFVLTLPKNSLKSDFAKVFINDGYINDISIVPNAAAGTTDLIFEAKSPLAYTVDSVTQKDRIMVSAVPQASVPPVSRGPNDSIKDKVIVIDPGHGGQEAGAVFNTQSGEVLKEKDINLSISLKLYDMLKNAGFKVYMTRMDDSTVGLYERADFANNLNAALFVSVHNNAGYSAQKGTMTLFYPSASDKTYGISGERFAQIAQEEMLLNLGTSDLGVWKRPKLAVLNTTRMPAILAEVSYLTNDSDRANLTNDAFRAKAAQGLYYSIIRALDEAQVNLKNQVPPVTAPLPVPQYKPEDYNPRNIYGFIVPSLVTSKCDYSWKNSLNPLLYDISIKLDYSKEVNKKYTLAQQRAEAEQVLKSMLDSQTVASIMEAVAYQKDYVSYIWEDEIETSAYKIYVRALKNTGICTIDILKK